MICGTLYELWWFRSFFEELIHPTKRGAQRRPHDPLTSLHMCLGSGVAPPRF